MCVICISKKGVTQPTKDELSRMFRHNPDGAGFMVARDGEVVIRKGFMTFGDLWESVRDERLTRDDAVIYHCRISTQAGVKPEMTQPFPISEYLSDMVKLNTTSNLGLAHNGIIPITTRKNCNYSDTALYITNYLYWYIDFLGDMRGIDEWVSGEIGASKLALLDGDGNVKTVGKFTADSKGRLYSNMFWCYNPYYSHSYKGGFRLL